MTEADLLRAIDDDPDDPSPYLVYADHLLERGDLRGELIQLQLQLEALAVDDLARMAVLQREADLQEHFTPVWEELGATWRFRRGFLCSLDLPAVVFGRHAAGATDLARLRELKLRDDPDAAAPLLDDLAAILGISSLPELLGATGGLSDDELASVLTRPSLPGLLELTLTGRWLGPAGGRALAAADLPRLRSLVLSDTGRGGAAVAGLLEHPSPRLPALETLALTTNQLTDDVVGALASWPPLAQLRSLDLSSTHTDAPGCNAIGDCGAMALVSSPHARRLTRLHLGDNPSITSETAFALASSPHPSQLAELSLSFTSLDDQGARALASSPSLSQLSHLDIGHTRVGDAGLAALLQLPRLTTLHLSGTPLTADGLRALVAAPSHLTSIRFVHHHLDLPASLLDALLLRFGPTSSST